MYRVIILTVLYLVQCSYQSSAPSGSVELSELSFDKILKKFDTALVKFDVAFPYGEKHDAYIALANEAKDVHELLVAEVGVKDYGNNDNQELAKRYGAVKDNFPVVKLFLKGKDEPITFDESKGFTANTLRRFVREHTGLYLSMPGCVNELDLLAMKFMKADKKEREGILKEVEQVQKKLTTKDVASGKIYKTIMEKIIEKGEDFPKTEVARVKKLLNEKVSKENMKKLDTKLNILQAFTASEQQAPVKEDL